MSSSSSSLEFEKRLRVIDNGLWSQIQQMITKKYIQVRAHPQFPEDLFIYNYNGRTQIDGVWNEATMLCRGLILDKDRNIVARPFPKFFNLDECVDVNGALHEKKQEKRQQKQANKKQETSTLPKFGKDVSWILCDDGKLSYHMSVYDKMDGSLGILYRLPKETETTDETKHTSISKLAMATRGSFNSPQAIKATDWLHSKYAHCLPKLNADWTYLFEIIYPANRVVVDYKTREELVLLGAIETSTGHDIPYETLLEQNLGFPLVPVHRRDWKTWQDVVQAMRTASIPAHMSEGFVLHLTEILVGSDDENAPPLPRRSIRLKVKYDSYKRTHAAVSMLDNIRVWEAMMHSSEELDKLYDLVPDEVLPWVKKVRSEIETRVESMLNAARNFLSEYHNNAKLSRRDIGVKMAARNKEAKETSLSTVNLVPAIVFALYDKNESKAQEIAYKQCKPEERVKPLYASIDSSENRDDD